MKCKNYTLNLSKNDKGSTLITVIVAIAFVTILTTIILGTTVVNVRMKGIDRRTKDDFYYAEKALGDIYTGIGEDLTVKAGDLYETAFNKIATVDDGGNIVMEHAEEAEKEFRTTYLKAVYNYLTPFMSDKTKLEDFITDKGTVLKVGDVEYQTSDGTKCGFTDPKLYRVALRDVEVAVEDTSEFRSVISTDLIINVPTVDFLGTNADVSEYGLIANKGLYIEGDATITGNVYAGVRSETDPNYGKGISDKDYKFYEEMDKNSHNNVFGGINIKDGTARFTGNYIVSKGDINLGGDKPRLEILSPSASDNTNLTNLWFTSMRTVSSANLDDLPKPVDLSTTKPTIDINANVFALNDLTLNADDSCVRIKGNYYGYNDKTLLGVSESGGPDSVYVDSNMLSAKRDDGKSSAIIVNGSDAYLNMKDINNFVLMGKAYIDFTSDSATNASATTTQIVPTAESVALKTNQQLYLMPPDFLDVPNPEQNGTGNFIISNEIANATDPSLSWFGLKYLNYGSEIKTPDLERPTPTKPTGIHEPFKVMLSDGTWVWYDYLAFNDKAWKPIIVDRKIVGYEDTPDESGAELGTGGSISSKAKFFYDIMNWKQNYQRAYDADPEKSSYANLDAYIDAKEALAVQPTAKRLFERIDRSMGYDYFDLRECIVGDKDHVDNAHYYAKNAVINYYRNDPVDADSPIISNVLSNTDGMYRYSSYPQKLFRRYVFLCTKLDGKEDRLIDDDPGEPTTQDMNDWKDFSENAPISNFVLLDNLKLMSNIKTNIQKASDDGLNPVAFGVCIAGKTGDDPASAPPFEISKSNTSLPNITFQGDTFEGIAIIDGDIEVDEGVDVRGLLMATGTITLKGNNTITYDRGLIQSRIEKEMAIIKNSNPGATWDDAINDKYCYLIRYLTKRDGTTYLYSVTPGSKIMRERIEADYNDFMHYENWQKGER